MLISASHVRTFPNSRSMYAGPLACIGIAEDSNQPPRGAWFNRYSRYQRPPYNPCRRSIPHFPYRPPPRKMDGRARSDPLQTRGFRLGPQKHHDVPDLAGQ